MEREIIAELAKQTSLLTEILNVLSKSQPKVSREALISKLEVLYRANGIPAFKPYVVKAGIVGPVSKAPTSQLEALLNAWLEDHPEGK